MRLKVSVICVFFYLIGCYGQVSAETIVDAEPGVDKTIIEDVNKTAIEFEKFTVVIQNIHF